MNSIRPTLSRFIRYFLIAALIFCAEDATPARRSHRNHRRHTTVQQKSRRTRSKKSRKTRRPRIRRQTQQRIWSYPNGELYIPGSYIFIDKPSCRLYLINGNDTIFRTSVCLGANYGDKTRSGDQKTPEGIFSIASIENSSGWSPSRNRYGGAYGPWFFRLKAPQSTHIGIHGTNRPTSIGRRESEGCIRMPNEKLMHLRQMVGCGMKVIITPDTASGSGIIPALPDDPAMLALSDSLRHYVATLDARVGVAIETDAGPAGINATDSFPMLSVMKFPLALALGHKLRKSDESLQTSLPVGPEDLHTDTYSPMLEKYPADKYHYITLAELLDYSLRYSDNNAADILIKYCGGPAAVDSLLKTEEYEEVAISRTENDMHRDPMLSYDNVATPQAIARMFRDFDVNENDAYARQIKQIVETCQTGKGRIPAAFKDSKAVIGHKTGTGPANTSTGRLIAVNDAGYIHLPDGRSYALAIFIKDSAYSLEETEAIIAHISHMVLDAMARSEQNP